MPFSVAIAHDFTCPWCWIGLSQARRMRAEFGVEIEWQGYEMYPDGNRKPQFQVQAGDQTDQPPIPTRLSLAYEAEGMSAPELLHPILVTHNAHEAVEYAKFEGRANQLVERLYRAYWVSGLDINSLSVLRLLATGLINRVDEYLDAIQNRQFADRIIPFESEANKTGVFHVPTFWIGSERYAEQPYSVLRSALTDALGTEPLELPYAGIQFPDGPVERPYVFMNMVATIDGKIISGGRNEHVMDLGSKADHAVMRWLEECADGVLIGAGVLRSTPNLWYRQGLLRFVASVTGNVDRATRFFSDDPSRAHVVKGDWFETMREIKALGVERLLVEGGSILNAELLKQGLIDEIFLTIAPKVKLGEDTPTIAGGEPFGRGELPEFLLLESHQVGDEMFLRYRRKA